LATDGKDSTTHKDSRPGKKRRGAETKNMKRRIPGQTRSPQSTAIAHHSFLIFDY